jgi:hypothetical protein
MPASTKTPDQQSSHCSRVPTARRSSGFDGARWPQPGALSRKYHVYRRPVPEALTSPARPTPGYARSGLITRVLVSAYGG